jgi:hypothetical protein
MNPDIFTLFYRAPGVLPLYEELERRIMTAYPDVTVAVKATQVSFYNTHAFAWASPPFRRRKGGPEVFLTVTFGLGHRLAHPRIRVATEPYPNRWTHHVIVQRPEEIDSELMGWIEQSYRFSLSKGKGRTRL